MTEADLPDDGETAHGPRRRRSTFTPPTEQRDVPINLGDAPMDVEAQPPASPPTAPPATPAATAETTRDAPPEQPPAGPAAEAPEVPAPAPRARPWDDSVLAPPERRSLSDEEIIAQMGGANADSGELIAALEEQMALRAREQDEFDSWEALIRQSFPEDEADELVARGRSLFDPEQPAEDDSPAGSIDSEGEGGESPAQSADDSQSEPIVLPRLGAEPAAVTPEVGEELPPTGSFERVLVDPEPAPETDAWPLAPAAPENGSGETEASSSVPSDDAGEDAGAPDVPPSDDEWLEAQLHVESVSVSEEPSGVTVVEHTEEVVSIREAIATKPAPEVPFEDVDAVTLAPGGFDRVGAEPTPDALRSDRLLQLLWAWWAIGTPIPLVMLGMWLTDQGLGFLEALGVSLLGALLAAVPLGVATASAMRSGLPTLVSSRAAFGLLGNLVPAALMLVVRLIVAVGIVWAAAWVTTGVLVESNYWNQEPALIQVILAAIFALIAAGVAVGGRPVVTVAVWIAAGGGLLGLVGVALLSVPFVDLSGGTSGGGQTASIVAGISVVFSALVVVWAHFGGDIARFQRPGSPSVSGPSIAAAGALVPTLILLALGAAAGASDEAARAALLADPFDTLLGPAPIWYPLPAIVVAAIPLVALAGLAVHSASYAVLSVGAALPRYAAATVAGAVVAVGVIATVVFVPELAAALPTVVLLLGVLVASWVGSYTGEFLTRRVPLDARALASSRSSFPTVRIAPLLGFVASVGIGWGLISSTASGFEWLGYLHPSLTQATGVDVASWQSGPLVAFLLSLVVASLAGIRGGVSTTAAKVAG